MIRAWILLLGAIGCCLFVRAVHAINASAGQRKARNLLQSSRPSPRVETLLLSELKQTQVDYDDHPFERRQRKLDEEFDPGTEPMNYIDGDSYEPLRIKYIMDPIEAQPDYSSTGFDEVLPGILDVVSETWSSHLSVSPISGNLPLSQQDCFGFFQPYISDSLEANGVSDADMAIYVGAETTLVENGQEVDLCEAGTLAFAFSCSIDQFDRPGM